MAMLLVTNKAQLHKDIVKGNFKYNTVCDGPYKLLSFKKIKVEHTNSITYKNGDFVVIAGTLIYDEKFGAKALEAIYRDFSGNVNAIRDKAIGNYTISIKKGANVILFVDANAIHDLYYDIGQKYYFIGNSLYQLLLTVTKNEYDRDKLIELSSQYCLLNGETFFKGVARLMSSQAISIGPKGEVQLISLDDIENFDIKNDSFNGRMDFMIGQLDKHVQLISKNFNKVALSMTGGLDSRIILSAFLKNNIKPELQYGIGNTEITNTKSEDLEINRTIAERYGLKLELKDWKNPEPIDLNWSDLMKRYGFLSCVYTGANIYYELENTTSDFIEYGYFGEPFRNVPWIEAMKSDTFTLDRFIDEFYLNNDVAEVVENFAGYKQNIKSIFLELCKKRNIDPQYISLDEFQVLHNVYRINADKVMVNLTNLFCYSYSILSQNTFTVLSERIPKKEKNNAYFMLHLINRLFPDILKIEIFSHMKKWRFNDDTFELKRKGFIKLDLVKRFLNKKGLSTRFLQKTYYMIKGGRLKEVSDGSDETRHVLKNKISDDRFKKIERLSLLANFVQMDFIFSNIKKSKETP